MQKRVKVRLGQSVRLNCHDSVGGGNANKWRPHTKWKHTKWYKNGRRLVQNALPQNISIKKKRSKSMLKIKNVAQKDLGTYRCRTFTNHKTVFRLVLDVPYPVSSEKIGKQ